jgi:hypothetical protein
MLHGERVLHLTKRLDERSYRVGKDSGTYRRNRSHLRKTNESNPVNDAHSSTPNAKVKRFVADQPAMSDYPTVTPVSEHVHNDTPTYTRPAEQHICSNANTDVCPAEQHICSNIETNLCITEINQGNTTTKTKSLNNIQLFLHINTDLINLIYIYHILFSKLKTIDKRRML